MFKMKRKKNENGEEIENAYDVFMRNYKTVPGFRPLVKLLGYGIFIFILILVAGSIDTGDTTATDSKTTTTTQEQVKVYADILNELRVAGTKISAQVAYNGEKYLLEGTVNESDFSGYIDTSLGTKKFKIKDNNVYELVLETETMNNELFGLIDKDFIVPNSLVNILSKESALKTVEEDKTKYMYTITKNNLTYSINALVKDEKCYKIEIKSEGIEYLITYNK